MSILSAYEGTVLIDDVELPPSGMIIETNEAIELMAAFKSDHQSANVMNVLREVVQDTVDINLAACALHFSSSINNECPNY